MEDIQQHRLDNHSSLWLAPHAHVTTTDSGAVVLDLRGNRYFGIPCSEARYLARRVENWPAADLSVAAESSAQLTDDVCNTISSLLQNGVLSLKAPPASAETITYVALPRNSLGTIPHQTSYRVRPLDAANFAIAYGRAAFSLRYLPFESVVRSVHRRKQAHHSVAASIPEFELVAIFRKIRRYTFTARGKCLLHSLALVHFLAMYRRYPTWVIGVRAWPWGAHSWVQRDHTVLDATPEQVFDFAPILTI
jgi:hypothetical protein